MATSVASELLENQDLTLTCLLNRSHQYLPRKNLAENLSIYVYLDRKNFMNQALMNIAACCYDAWCLLWGSSQLLRRLCLLHNFNLNSSFDWFSCWRAPNAILCINNNTNVVVMTTFKGLCGLDWSCVPYVTDCSVQIRWFGQGL